MPKRLEELYDDPRILEKAPEATKLLLRNWWDSERQFVDPMRDKIEEWYNLYRNYIEIKDDDVLSNFHLPLTFSHVESYLPREGHQVAESVGRVILVLRRLLGLILFAPYRTLFADIT